MFPLNMVILHSYVSLLEGKLHGRTRIREVSAVSATWCVKQHVEATFRSAIIMSCITGMFSASANMHTWCDRMCWSHSKNQLVLWISYTMVLQYVMSNVNMSCHSNKKAKLIITLWQLQSLSWLSLLSIHITTATTIHHTFPSDKIMALSCWYDASRAG